MTNLGVVVLEPESSGLGLVGAAARLGLRVHVVDRRPLDEAPAALVRAVADRVATYTPVETRDAAAVTAAVRALAVREQLLAVVPGFEYAVEVAAAVNASLGLHGLDPAAARAMRDKAVMKDVLVAAGVPVAPGVVLGADDFADHRRVAAAGAAVGYPAVVKPVDGCGSVLVRRVNGPGELAAHVALAHRRPVADMGKVLGSRLLVEGYVAGPEVSVEGVVAGGEVVVAAVTAKHLGCEPHFVEVGHVVEARLPAAQRAMVERLAVQAVRALGLKVGGFHVEARLTAAGPVVMEVAARLGGDHIPALVALARGRDLHDAAVRSFVGLPVPPPVATLHGAAAVRFFTVAAPRRLVDREGLVERVVAVPGCVEVSVDAAAGAVLEPATDFRQRFGHAVVVAPTAEELDARLALLDERLDLAARAGVT